MRKLLSFALMLAFAVSANAQLRVSTNGQVTVGNDYEGSSIKPYQPNLAGFATIFGKDTTSNLKIMGSKTSGHGGVISFGESKHVYVKELYTGTASDFTNKGRLELGGDGGMLYNCGTDKIFEYDPKIFVLGAQGAAFSIYRVVSAPQFLTSSDANLKTNVKPLENISELLADITPVSYNLKSRINSESTSQSVCAQNSEDKHLQYGFIAQEVREIYPDLVYEDSDGLLSIDYTGFIPLLVDAFKAMKATVEEQQLEIEKLRNPMQEKDVDPYSETVVASLSQNRPNPFRVTTAIDCVIPESVSSAFICVYDLNGGQKLRCDIKERGNVEVTIEGNTLTAGMYIYTLVCDGHEIDSKRMILTD